MCAKKRKSPAPKRDTFTYEFDPVKREVGGEEAEKVIWSTKALEAAVKALNEGLPLKVNPFCGKDTQLLKPELLYRRTKEEVDDYIKCMQDPVYFASKCYLMTPAGLQPCKLRDYQVDYLNLVAHNRFTCFRSCRQSGKTLNFVNKVNILLNSDDIIRKIDHFYIKDKDIYELPLFEIYNLYCKQTWKWKIKYHLYKIIYKLNEKNSLLKNICWKIISLLDVSEYGISNNEVMENFPITNIEVETDKGYKPVTNLIIKKPMQTWRIETENGYWLEGADKHIVFKEDYSEIFIDELRIGDKILTIDGESKIVKIIKSSLSVCMCDLSVDSEYHRFYSNGILSHNSTTTAIYALWVVLFHNDKNALILSKSAAASADLLEKIKTMYRFLPYYLKLGTMKWNQGSISFDNNSQLAHEAFSPTAGLGKTINMLILDEFAWTPQNDARMFYMNIIPTVTTIPDSNVCIMSTQNGHNLFYEIFDAAEKKKNIYIPFTVDWWQVPNYNPETQQWEPRTEEWKEMMIGVLGSEESFYYQYGTAFLASDKCLVSRECIGRIRDYSILYEVNNDLEIVQMHKDALTWDPNFDLDELKTGYFFILIDLAEGGGGDFTVFNIFQVISETQFKQVGHWHSNKVDIEKAALDFWLIASQLFNNDRCLFSIEWNTYGALFYNLIINYNEPDYDEETLWRFNCPGIDPDGLDQSRFVNYKKTSIEEQIVGKTKHTSKYIPGIKFTGGNKSTACSLLKILFEKGQVILTSLENISELENFEDKNGNGSYKASYGHDDLIMSCCQIPMMQQTPIWKDFIEDFNLLKLSNSLNSKWNDNNTNSIYGELQTMTRTEQMFTPPELGGLAQSWTI